ncbi:MAG TPA: UDP-N-acetylglucosamine 2-epimerase (non-hydrolyzing) [Candidatus Cloacimonas sp.]|jgi:UDP-GlcNAc3NAcA epimerase|nr:UDP-GlcNAc3NAcA epimerase [Candidatus Cloacimonadota bacterium]HCX72701.1 UDP-N-acetylglucosamine 2-epimerase (non-hydrolyzing) [Candidatus Cloacimonas sp.]
MKLLTIIGARPQFIKAATVSRVVAEKDDIQEVIVHTGQHFDDNMSQIFFQQMQIPKPDYNLEINSLSHGAMTGRMLEKIETVLQKEKPDWVLVYGDTNSTIAGALAAKKLHIKVAHVEAGLRSFNMRMPEEVNRILTDRISDILFCPTQTAVDNLTKEGFEHLPAIIDRCGDVMYDAALFYTKRSRKPKLELPEKFLLATCHRAENTDDEDRLAQIFAAFAEISQQTSIILPLHPRTRKILDKRNIKIDAKNLLLIEPVGYLEMVWLLQNCQMVLTDSGGLQKEAYFFQKPCLTLRDETEWIELVQNSVNKICGASKHLILKNFKQFSSQKIKFPKQLYGNGKAAQRIVSLLK